jgi:polysaccharide biosynthesis transport protein
MGWAGMSFLRRYFLWIALATAACTIGAWGIAGHQPVTYSTSATVNVQAGIIQGVTVGAPNLATEEAVATSGNVVNGPAKSFHMTGGALAKHLSVSNPANTQILQIACSMPTAKAATRCANAVATSFANYSNEVGLPKKAQQKDQVQVSLLTRAPLPTSQASKRKLELLVLGVILGLALGTGTAFLRDRLDDRVRDRADLGRCLHSPVLGEIPALTRRSAPAESVAINAPRSASAEAYRHLRARVSPLIASTGSRGKVLLVTSPQPGEGRTSVAGNLAAVMAFAGAKVLLVDADRRHRRHRSLSEVFRVSDAQPGLSDLLADRARLDDVIVPTDVVPGLRFMTAGTVTDRPADMFDPARLRRAFSRITVVADVVIVDSGPLQAVSDPLALAPVSDIVVVVADTRRTGRAAATAAAQEIRGIAPVATVGVLNRAPTPRWRSRARTEIIGQPESAQLPAHELSQNHAPVRALPADDPPPFVGLRKVQAAADDPPTVVGLKRIQAASADEPPIVHGLKQVQSAAAADEPPAVNGLKRVQAAAADEPPTVHGLKRVQAAGSADDPPAVNVTGLKKVQAAADDPPTVDGMKRAQGPRSRPSG